MYSVVHVIDTLSVGGAQRLLTILATSAESACPAVLDLRGHSSAMADELIRRGVKVESAGIRRSLSPVAWWRVWRALRRLPSRLVHLHLTDSVIIGAPLARLMGRMVIVTVHNSVTVPSRSPSARLKSALEGFALRHFTDHVILVGHNVAKANRARLLGVQQTVLPNVIIRPPSMLPEARARFRAQAGVQGTDVVFVSTGRLHPQKDHQTLIAAFWQLRQTGVPAVLWILGDGQYRARLLAQAQEMKLGTSCRFFGSQADVASFLMAADIFVMSSAWEGLPLGILEGMAAGLPILATSVGDLPSILGPSGGVLVPPADPQALAHGMATLAADADLRAVYAARSTDIVAPYLEADAWLDSTVALYRSVLGSKDS